MPVKKTKTVKKPVKKKKTASPKKTAKKKITPVKKTVKKKTLAKTSKKAVKKMPKEVLIGKVVHYFNKAKVAVIKLKAPLAIDEKIRIKGGEADFTQKVKSMEIDREKIKKAKARQEIGMKVNKKAREGYRVFKVS